MRDRAETGLDDSQGISSPDIVRNYEKISIWKSLKDPTILGGLMITLTAAPFFTTDTDVFGMSGLGLMPAFMGAAGPFLLLVSAVLIMRVKTVSDELPLRRPMQSGGKDRHLKDKYGRPTPSNGAFFGGNEVSTGKEVWFSTDELKQHSFGLGTTGSGKTEKALGVVANALAMGSGFLYLDAKADIDFYYKVMALARRFGREDDVRFLNFSNISPNVGEHWHSNNMNFLLGLPKDEMANLMVGLMTNMGGDNKVFQDRAEQLLQVLIAALVWLRDNAGWSLTISLISSYLDLEALIRFAEGYDINGNKFDLPRDMRNGIMGYIGGLAGAKKKEISAWAGKLGSRGADGSEAKDPITPEMTKQHGFVIMQLTRTMQRLSSDYSHIFNIRYGDIDLDDIILNRRIVIIQIPVLGKSDSEVQALAKIIIANISMTMSRALGARTTGTVADVVEARVTTSPSPFYVVFDEAGTYMVKGLSKLYKQGRSLNIALFMFAQDMTALRAIEEKEADQVIGSANNVDIMRIQDAKSTGGFAIETGDKMNVGMVASFERNAALAAGMTATDDRSNRIENRHRLTFADLSSQPLGQSTLITYGRVIRYKTFYAEPASTINKKKFRSLFIRRLLSWDPPTRSDILTGIVDVDTTRSATQYGERHSPSVPVTTTQASIQSNIIRPAFQAQPFQAPAGVRPAPPGSKPVLPTPKIGVPPAMPRMRQIVPPVAPVGAFIPNQRSNSDGLIDIDKVISRFLNEVDERHAEVDQARVTADLLADQDKPIPVTTELGQVADHLMPLACLPNGPLDTASAMLGCIMTAAMRIHGRYNRRPAPFVPADWMPAAPAVDPVKGLPVPGKPVPNIPDDYASGRAVLTSAQDQVIPQIDPPPDQEPPSVPNRSWRAMRSSAAQPSAVLTQNTEDAQLKGNLDKDHPLDGDDGPVDLGEEFKDALSGPDQVATPHIVNVDPADETQAEPAGDDKNDYPDPFVEAERAGVGEADLPINIDASEEAIDPNLLWPAHKIAVQPMSPADDDDDRDDETLLPD